MRPYVGMLVMISSTRIGIADRRNSIDTIVYAIDEDGWYIETKLAARPDLSRKYKGPLSPLPEWDTIIIPILE